MKDKNQTCVICQKEFTEWGNNPEPIKNFNEGKCCNSCNNDIVIPYRIYLSHLDQSIQERLFNGVRSIKIQENLKAELKLKKLFSNSIKNRKYIEQWKTQR